VRAGEEPTWQWRQDWLQRFPILSYRVVSAQGLKADAIGKWGRIASLNEWGSAAKTAN
jgi:hypothetical protein